MQRTTPTVYQIRFAGIALAFACSQLHGEGILVVEYDLPETQVLERCPLVVVLRVRNVGTSAIMTIFPEPEQGILADRTTLILRDGDGNVHALRYRGGPLVEHPAPIAINALKPGDERAVERLISLVVPTGRDRKYGFLPPGKYVGSFEVALLQGKKLVSDEFELTILKAQGKEAAARDRVQFRHVAFLEGRDSPFDASDYSGRKWHRKINVSRFGELENILNDFPDSTYAKWIRLWKLYHHGPIEDALQYARNHPDFPLSDNLMLRMARRLFGSMQYARCRNVVFEMKRLFPDGDCRSRRLELEKKLRKKP